MPCKTKFFRIAECYKNFYSFVIDSNSEWTRSKILEKEAEYQKIFDTLVPKGLNDIQNLTKSTFKIPIKIPYGTAGIENLSVINTPNIIFTGHKNLCRIFHYQKLNL